MQANIHTHPWREPAPPRIDRVIQRIELQLITTESPLRTDRLLCKLERLRAIRALRKAKEARA